MEDLKPGEPKQLKRKKPWWLIAIIFLLIVVFIWGGLYVLDRSNDRFMRSEWYNVNLKSERLNRTLKEDIESVAPADIEESAEDTLVAVKEARYRTAQRPTYVINRNSLGSFNALLESYENYLEKAQQAAVNVESLTEENINDLKKAVEAFQGKRSDFKKQTALELEALPTSIITIPTVLQQVRSQSLAAKDKEEEEAKAAANEKAQVEISTNKFLEYFMAKNTDNMKRQMTDSYIREFNFEEHANNKDLRYVSSRIVNSEKISATEYQVTVRIVLEWSYKNDEGKTETSSSTNENKYAVIADNNYGKWLIDRDVR